MTRSFGVFFHLRLNKRLNKQPWGWWFETLSRSLWRHCNVKSRRIYLETVWIFQCRDTIVMLSFSIRGPKSIRNDTGERCVYVTTTRMFGPPITNPDTNRLNEAKVCHSGMPHWQPLLGILSWSSHSLQLNRPISQIPECIRQISHNATFCNRNVHTCEHFCHKMLYCGIWHRCILGFVRWVYLKIGHT